MKALLIIALLVLPGIRAQAAGREEAWDVCDSMSFASHKEDCVFSLGAYEYFDEGALALCLEMSFDSGKQKCLSIVGDRLYDFYEIMECAENGFDSSKNRCLKKAGRPLPSIFQ